MNGQRFDDAKSHPGTVVGEAMRDGETGLGVPRSKFKPVRTPASEKTEQNPAGQKEEFTVESLQLPFAQDGDTWQLPRALRLGLSLSLLAVTAFLGLMIVTDAAQFIASLSSMPGWARWVCGTLFMLFSGAICYVMCILMKKAIGLRKNQQIHLQQMMALAERRNMQQALQKQTSDAKKILTNYIVSHPLTEDQNKKQDFMTEQAYNDLCNAKNILLQSSLPSLSWCKEFHRIYQSELDSLASTLVQKYALKASIGTAASPFGTIDRVIVLFAALAMIKDLLRIYNLRPVAGQSLVLLAKVIIVTYLSGISEGIIDEAGDALTDSVSSEITDAMGGVLVKGLKITAEAGITYLFIKRIGAKTISLLQPIVA